MITAIRWLKKATGRLWTIALRLLRVWAKLDSNNYEYFDARIDSTIAPLVKAINESGRMQTIDSCGGHVGRYFAPYVSFETSVETATQFATLLDTLSSGDSEQLATRWIVIGVFRKNRGLVFRLFSPLYDDAAESLWSSIFHFGVKRRTINNDILSIASQVKYQMAAADETEVRKS